MPIVEREHHHLPKWVKVVTLLVCVVVLGGGLVIWQIHERAVKEKQLQAELTNASAGVNFKTADNVATQLINGQKAGTYKIDTKTLSEDYLYRGTARANLQEYASAIQDYQEAIKLDPTDNQEGALQGEVSAGYRGGERQQLIPLLQQLVTISSARNSDPLGGTPQEYEQDIQDIKNNEPIGL